MERVCGRKPEGVAKDGFIHLINSGAAALDGNGASKDSEGNGCMKPWWDVTEADIGAMLDATDWCRANYEYFRGGGFSSHFRTQAEMPVTLIRVNLVDGVGPVLQLAEGYTAVLEDDMHQTLDLRTDRTWPTTWFAPRLTGKGAFKDVYSVMANWGANHGAFAYGHIGKDLITLASMLRIPVSLHNVDDDDIYRPHSWSSFGTKELESADFRACTEYGPLYKAFFIETKKKIPDDRREKFTDTASTFDTLLQKGPQNTAGLLITLYLIAPEIFSVTGAFSNGAGKISQS